MNRFDKLPTLRVDPAKKITFSYRKKAYNGLAGDTIATALFANGIRVFSRSLKYHRPRGLYSLDGESANTFMTVNGIPNICTENTRLQEGMQVEAQNVKGSPEFDLMGFLDNLDWAMPAGFYYRTMHKPAKMWPYALKQVRKTAGLGKIAADLHLPGTYDAIYPQTDICIIGGGPAGMAAALTASEQGLRVTLLEARPWFGGYYDYRNRKHANGVPLHKIAREWAEKVEQADNIRIFSNTAVVGAYTDNLITAFQKGSEADHFTERYIEIRAKSVVVATGCIERPLLFENNERPGVMQAGCAHRLTHTYGLIPGKQAVFSIGHDLGIETALDLHDAGLDVQCVADIREEGQDGYLLDALTERNIPLLRGWVATQVQGKKSLSSVTLKTVQGTFDKDMPCDTLIASAGLTPVTGPLLLAHAKLSYDHHSGFFLPSQLPPNLHAAGRLLGLNHSSAIEHSGRLAGLSAAADCGVSLEKAIEDAQEALADTPDPDVGCKLVMAPVRGRKTFICFDEDTTVKNIKQALKMGFDATELIKRFTAAGTGPGQSGIPGHNLALFVGQYHGDTNVMTRPTTVRAPLVPTYLATYAGGHHVMCKRTPMHQAQKKAGGIMRNIGVWKRARYFSQDFSCKTEIANVRNNAGMLDATTLGKFRLFGPDALKVLQRVYVGDMTKAKEGKIKYSAMCNEDGCVIDDGVVIKRTENDYYLTTSSARAGATVEWIRYHTRYDGWNFHLVNLTDALGVINLAGPNARKVLQRVTEADVSNEAFPFAAYREFIIANAVPVRAMRLGFVGELSYELHVPSSFMEALWQILTDAGKEFDIKNFGLEAQNVLRMEKGHIILGSESEQRTTLHDVGLGFLWYRQKPEAKTVGSFALKRTEYQEDRLTLVGFETAATDRAPKDGSIIVDNKIRGYVCIARHSHTLDKSVGMALVESTLAKDGTSLDIYEDECNDQLIQGTVVPMPFYDPQGQRLRM